MNARPSWVFFVCMNDNHQLDKSSQKLSKSIVKIAPDINKYLRYSQVLIIAQTLKALDFLLKQYFLDIAVFYTQKNTQEG